MDSLRRFFAEHIQEILVGGVSLPLLIGALMLLLGNNIILMLILSLTFLLSGFVSANLKELLKRRRPPQIGGEVAFQVPRRGVIFTLGLHSDKPNSVTYLVKEQLKPEFIGFLGTSQTSHVVKNLCLEMSLQEGQFKIETWETTAIREGKVKTNLVIDWMLDHGLKEKDIVLDLTGGTATMSVAAFMAADERRIDCQYIYSDFDKDKNRIIPGSQKPILITRYTQVEK